MTKIDDGGSAFPSHGSMGEVASEGMSIRDYFAGQALAGEFAAQNEYTGAYSDSTSDMVIRDRANLIYRMADAMLAARKAGGE